MSQLPSSHSNRSELTPPKQRPAEPIWITPASKRRLEAVSKDVASLSDYETRLSDKIQLLLDAVLGFINIQQNDLFKILTIVSVVGVPPTRCAVDTNRSRSYSSVGFARARGKR